MLVNQFKQLVNKSSGVRVHGPGEYRELCDFLGIDLSGDYARQWVIDKLNQLIAGLISVVDGEAYISRQEFKDIQEALVYEAILNEVDNSEYLMLSALLIGKENKINSFSDHAKWEQALTYARNMSSFSPTGTSFKTNKLRSSFTKAYDIAHAAKHLSSLGCVVKLQENHIEIAEGIPEIVDKIEEEIVSIGAELFLSRIFGRLVAEGSYMPTYSRYVIFNQITTYGATPHKIIPYGYLLNLCVKHLGKPGKQLKVKDIDVRMDSACNLAISLAAVWDIRRYSVWEVPFQSVETLPKFLTRLALFDAAIGFPNTDFVEIIEMMENLFTWVDPLDFESNAGFTICDLIKVATIIEQIALTNGPTAIYLSKLKRVLPTINPETLGKILGCLSHSAGEINPNYRQLNDFKQLNFDLKPLVALTPTKFLLCDKSWCASGFYEVLISQVRAFDNKCDGNVGVALELFIYKKLNQKGIKHVHGQYHPSIAPPGEADLIIESENNIAIIEIKKKILTKKAKGGSDIQLIKDLASSLLDAQIQAGRTEIILRAKNEISLVGASDGSTITVSLNNRNVDRIALTQWDYGCFQDRTFTTNLLSNMSMAEIGLLDKSDEGLNKDFEKLSGKLMVLTDQYEELDRIDPSFSHFPFFNCWFLSISQLLTIIRYSDGNQEFEKALAATRHVSLQTLNFYVEFYHGYIAQRR
ncbi:hypothetical protein GFS24_20760 [Chitinophaga sp. SYP-B3965]|uniref:hypothetical protein n=1 Tax=Chitinophaga sp. SYP-B3965 TaxID=2663120 RepID=UPI001299EC4D|nr:hypothetical protein [Chitinophaga sp. SYP-B3965]MRG47566.1 hypothetical protein [Chitinophaga sp. SYP-B3965]